MRFILQKIALIAFGLFLVLPLQAAIQNIDIQVGKQSTSSTHFVPFTETIENYVVECDCTTLTLKEGGFQVDIDYSKDPAGAFDKTVLIQTPAKLIRYHFRGIKIGSPVVIEKNINQTIPKNQQYQYESHFFFTQACSHCRRLRFVVFPEFQKNHPGLLKITEYDIAKEENLLKLLAVTKKLGVQSKTPALQIGDQIFLGEEEIVKSLDLVVNEKIDMTIRKDGTMSGPVLDGETPLQWNQKDFGLMVMAALIDGINPCAFATLFFFIAYLNFQKKGRREVFVLGASFITGIYVCYFLIGLGIFHFLLSLQSFFIFSKLLTKGFALLALVFALFSFYDAFIVWRTGKTSEMKLQLPMKLKQMIHAIIRSRMKETEPNKEENK